MSSASSKKLTISVNICFLIVFVVSSILFYQHSHTLWIRNDEHKAIDVALIAIYLLPFGIIFIAFAVGFTILFATVSSHHRSQLHSVILFLVCFNIIFKFQDNVPSAASSAIQNPLAQFVTSISCNLLIQIINLIFLYISIAIITIFFPIILISGSFTDDKYLSLASLPIQCVIIIINSFFHLFCLDSYGYYSLVIILTGVIYVLIWIIHAALMMPDIHVGCFAYLYFEFISLIVALTLAFVVQYNSEYGDYYALYWSSVINFIVYFFPNIPGSKLLLMAYHYARFSSNQFWRFVSEQKSGEYNFTDRMYYLLFVNAYGHGNIGTKLLYDHNSAEKSSLLYKEDGYNSTFALNTVQCFKMQYEYLKCTAWEKRRILRQLHPRKGVDNLVLIMICCYMITSLFVLIYPIFWMIYAWIYLELMTEESIFVDNYFRTSNAEYIFVWIMLSFIWGCVDDF